jgi:hypothetical protein
MIPAAMLRGIFVAVLAVRLLVDMATPLMPGAYRFNPADSIEAHRTQSVRSAAQVVVRPTVLPQVAVNELGAPRADVSARVAADVRVPRFRPSLPRHAPDRGPEAAEDH